MKKLIQTLCAAAIVAVAATAQAGTITAKGSDTLVILAQKWAEVYMSKSPGTTIQVTGGGSGTGFAALQNKTTDLANASRQIKAKEKIACIKAFRRPPTEYKVALDGLSVYIFSGGITDWSQVGGKPGRITVYSRENSSGTYEFFKKNVLKGKDFVTHAQTMPGTAAVLQAVGKDRTGIGYGGAAYGAGAKAIRVKKDANSPAVAPTEENVISGEYPIWRYLYVYVNPALDKGELGAYLKWIRSAEGQKIVKNVGYYPLPENLQLSSR
jgi:phosphate transport system substrate-binding protein